MGHDPVVDEVRAAREAYAKRFNYDVYAIFDDIKRRQAESGREYVTLPPRKVKPGKPVRSTDS